MDSVSAYQHSRRHFADFPSLRRPSAPPPASSGAPPPYSSASLGPSFRSRSLDHRRFPISVLDDGAAAGANATTVQRTYYASRPGGAERTYSSAGAAASKYRGELFANKTAGGTEQQQTYRSSSSDRAGITVVPIRREATLPARKFEWRTSSADEWKQSAGSPIVSQLEEARDQQQQEYTKYDRSVRYNHQRKVWPPPLPQGIYGGRRATERMEMLEGPRGGGTLYYPDSTDYSSFRKSQQNGSDTQQKELFHRDRHERHQRSHREWHSGGGYRDYGHYGAMGSRRLGGGDGGGGGYHYREAVREEQGGAGSGRGAYYGGAAAHQQRYRHEYSNGWSQGGAKRSGGFFGRGTKSKSSTSGAHWSHTGGWQQQKGPKRYRKIRCGCFNLIWPPWAIEPSEAPRPMYGNGSADQQRPYERSVPIEHHRSFDDDRRPPYDRNGVTPPRADHRAEGGGEGERRNGSQGAEAEKHRSGGGERAVETTRMRQHPDESPMRWGRRE